MGRINENGILVYIVILMVISLIFISGCSTTLNNPIAGKYVYHTGYNPPVVTLTLNPDGTYLWEGIGASTGKYTVNGETLLLSQGDGSSGSVERFRISGKDLIRVSPENLYKRVD
jgi:hypothetical protein